MIPNVVRLNIQLTKKCNQRCQSCNSYEMDSSNELSLDEWKKVIKDATVLFPIRNVAFTGGEPTLYPYFLDIASYARQFSNNISVTTNGYFCTSKNNVKALVDSGVNRFSFSYHGVGIHDSFTRVNGCEERLRQALEWIIEEKENHPNLYVKIGSLYDGQNLDEIEKVLLYAESVGVDLYIELLDDKIPVFASSLLAANNKNKKINQLKLENDLLKIKQWKEQDRKILIDEKGIEFIKRWFLDMPILDECPLWKTDLYIESNGNVKTGCWLLPAVGNIRNQSLQEIIECSAYYKNIEDMIHRRCTGCTCGYLMQAKSIKPASYLQ